MNAESKNTHGNGGNQKLVLEAHQGQQRQLTNILDNFINRREFIQESSQQKMLRLQNNESQEVKAFMHMMSYFYEGSVRISNDEIELIDEESFPDIIRKEIIATIKEQQDGDLDDEDVDTGPGSVAIEYINSAKKQLGEGLARFGLELKEKYKIENDYEDSEYDEQEKTFHPVFHVTHPKKFVNLLKAIQNNEEMLSKKIHNILGGLREQLIEYYEKDDDESINYFRNEIPNIRKELERIGLRNNYPSNEYKSILYATEYGHLKVVAELYGLGFNVEHWYETTLYREVEDLPIFIQDMIKNIRQGKDEGRGPDAIVDLHNLQNQLDMVIKVLGEHRNCKPVFLKARTDLLTGLAFILEQLGQPASKTTEGIPDSDEQKKRKANPVGLLDYIITINKRLLNI